MPLLYVFCPSYFAVLNGILMAGENYDSTVNQPILSAAFQCSAEHWNSGGFAGGGFQYRAGQSARLSVINV
jgi:hypothetical protein